MVLPLLHLYDWCVSTELGWLKKVAACYKLVVEIVDHHKTSKDTCLSGSLSVFAFLVWGAV